MPVRARDTPPARRAKTSRIAPGIIPTVVWGMSPRREGNDFDVIF